MAASPIRGRGRRARRGSLARPVNARMYRGTWLLVGLPLLVAAFSVGRGEPLPAPSVPPTFDGTAAAALAEDLVGKYPERAPGSLGPAQWVAEKFALFCFNDPAPT